jgi:hypothetical protein
MLDSPLMWNRLISRCLCLALYSNIVVAGVWVLTALLARRALEGSPLLHLLFSYLIARAWYTKERQLRWQHRELQ